MLFRDEANNLEIWLIVMTPEQEYRLHNRTKKPVPIQRTDGRALGTVDDAAVESLDPSRRNRAAGLP